MTTDAPEKKSGGGGENRKLPHEALPQTEHLGHLYMLEVVDPGKCGNSILLTLHTQPEHGIYVLALQEIYAFPITPAGSFYDLVDHPLDSPTPKGGKGKSLVGNVG